MCSVMTLSLASKDIRKNDLTGNLTKLTSIICQLVR